MSVIDAARRRRGFRFLPDRRVYASIACCAVCLYGQLNVQIAPGARESLLSVHPSAEVKVVFMYLDTMRYVDFSEAAPQIHTMKNVAAAYFPVISPDGNWITYQTGVEAEGPCVNANPGIVWCRRLTADGVPIKVADTGYVPRFVQNAAPDSPEIIYSTSVACPGKVCYADGKTVKKKLVGGSPQPAQTVCALGSYYGGLSRDERFLVTGWPAGPNAFMLDLQEGATQPRPVHTMRVKKNLTQADTFVSIGTCNISRSASAVFTNSMLFYDFSSSAVNAAGCHHPLLGSWGVHEKLFISRYDGEDLKVFDMPADRPLTPPDDAQGMGEAIGKQWYFPEWSNHPYFAAASLLVDRLFTRNGSWQHTENNESVYLVNLKDSAYVKLLKSSDTSSGSKVNLKYPFLWVAVSAGFKEDPTWLKSTIWERAAQGVIGGFENRRAPGCGSMPFFGKGGDRFVLYSASGKRIKSVTIRRNSGVSPLGLFQGVHSGVYVLGRETRGSDKRFVRWVVQNR